MSAGVLLLLLINVLVAGVLATLVVHQQRQLKALQARVQTLATGFEDGPLDEPLRRRGLILIEILNPFELAARESRFAGSLSGIAPHIVQRLVLKRAADMLQQELSARGVVAEVRPHHVG